MIYLLSTARRQGEAMARQATIRFPPQAAVLVAVCALALSSCVTLQSDYDQLQQAYDASQATNQQLQSENTALETQLAQQQNTYAVSSDLLFPSGGFGITQNGQATLNDIIGKLKLLKNIKIAVYGYTDDEKPGESFKKQGIKTNLELSSKRADAVAAYLRGHGIDPHILSSQGRGEAHPLAPNSTSAGRAKNRRIEIVEGPAA